MKEKQPLFPPLLHAGLFTLSSLLGFIIISILTGNDLLSGWDQQISGAMENWHVQELLSLMRVFSYIGSMPNVFVILPVLFLICWMMTGTWGWWRFYLTVLLGSYLFNEIVRFVFLRPRPPLPDMEVVNRHGFPSNHAVGAFVLYSCLLLILWPHVGTVRGRMWLVTACLVMVVVISFSRVFLHVHYPSDILGGWLLGASWLGLCLTWQEIQRLRQARAH
ncbi:phosphatase PAP2 family protein [Brevibacillus dissolubilis]|uniref:phosphatase PAP2 family protein n=1 Tax=Brevibacillus dissolubilis TaxID=1844116 RepID=UPI0011177D8F|nr:phosphatase PAP2 family protein [Brevibacillus dissolubilis]